MSYVRIISSHGKVVFAAAARSQLPAGKSNRIGLSFRRAGTRAYWLGLKDITPACLHDRFDRSFKLNGRAAGIIANLMRSRTLQPLLALSSEINSCVTEKTPLKAGRFGLLLLVSLAVAACGGGSGGGAGGQDELAQPRPTGISGDENYAVDLPTHFLVAPRGESGKFVQPAVIDTDNSGSNAITNAGATLGRVLFYDKRLSIDDTVSCASCHIQAFGFSDAPDKIVSEGVNGGFTRRRSMGLANARFFASGRAFWDLRAESLEAQALIPILDAAEMGMPDLRTLEQKLAAIDYYPPLFEAAFQSNEITSDRVAKALAQFVRSMVSFNSRYDQGRVEQTDEQGLDPVESFLQPLPNFSEEENRGKEIFLTPIVEGGGQCFGCHSTEAFINAVTGPTSNGLDFDKADFSLLDDQGACESPTFAGDTSFCGKFKVPSLRNVAVRGPFMHDGRFETLEQVIDHYSEGIEAHPNLAEVLKDAEGNPVRLNFSPEDKAALVAFLNTLTDSVFLSDPKFSNPFR